MEDGANVGVTGVAIPETLSDGKNLTRCRCHWCDASERQGSVNETRTWGNFGMRTKNKAERLTANSHGL